MPSNNFQSIPIDEEPDVILSVFEKDNRFISTERISRAEDKKKRNELDDHWFRRKETVNVDFSFTNSAAESDKATTNFVNLHGPTADRTLRIDERKELGVIERMKREDPVTRFAEILLRTIVRMSVFA